MRDPPEQLELLPEPAAPAAPLDADAVIVLRHEVAPDALPPAAPAPPPPAEAPPIPLDSPAPVSPPFAAVAPPVPPASPQRPPPLRHAPRPRGAPERELFVPEGTRYGGEVLRRAREARGLTMEQVCQRTKILRQHLENLEADRYDRLPVAVYLRGILIALSKELRLDGQKVARSYLEAIAAAREHGGKPR